MRDNPAVRAQQLLILLAVAGSVIAGGAIIIVGFASIFHSIWHMVESGKLDIEAVRAFSVDVVEVADAFLLGVVMFIIALGLYQLFLHPGIQVPEWLRVNSLSELKEDLLAVTIVLLGISFLGRVVEWEGEQNIIYYGVAIAAVLVPLVVMFALLVYVNNLEEKEELEKSDVRTPAPAHTAAAE